VQIFFLEKKLYSTILEKIFVKIFFEARRNHIQANFLCPHQTVFVSYGHGGAEELRENQQLGHAPNSRPEKKTEFQTVGGDQTSDPQGICPAISTTS